jgi:hypothetical protein
MFIIFSYAPHLLVFLILVIAFPYAFDCDHHLLFLTMFITFFYMWPLPYLCSWY